MSVNIEPIPDILLGRGARLTPAGGRVVKLVQFFPASVWISRSASSSAFDLMISLLEWMAVRRMRREMWRDKIERKNKRARERREAAAT